MNCNVQEKHILWSNKHISNLKTFAKPLLNILQCAKFAMLSSSPPPLSLILKLLLKADIWNCIKQSEVAQLLSPASGGRLYLIWHSICKKSTFKVYFDFLFIFVMTCFSLFSVPGRFYAFSPLSLANISFFALSIQYVFLVHLRLYAVFPFLLCISLQPWRICIGSLWSQQKCCHLTRITQEQIFAYLWGPTRSHKIHVI